MSTATAWTLNRTITSPGLVSTVTLQDPTAWPSHIAVAQEFLTRQGIDCTIVGTSTLSLVALVGGVLTATAYTLAHVDPGNPDVYHYDKV